MHGTICQVFILRFINKFFSIKAWQKIETQNEHDREMSDRKKCDCFHCSVHTLSWSNLFLCSFFWIIHALMPLFKSLGNDWMLLHLNIYLHFFVVKHWFNANCDPNAVLLEILKKKTLNILNMWVTRRFIAHCYVWQI